MSLNFASKNYIPHQLYQKNEQVRIDELFGVCCKSQLYAEDKNIEILHNEEIDLESDVKSCSQHGCD